MKKAKIVAAVLIAGIMISGCGTREKTREAMLPDVQNEQKKATENTSEQEAGMVNPRGERSEEETEAPAEENTGIGDEVQTEENTGIGDEVQTEENADISEEVQTEEAASNEAVDIKDYLDVWTVDFGGNLEQQLADKLGSVVETSEMGDSYVICDGAIEFYGAADNTGYFVWEYKPVENFYIYGVSVGMDSDEAVNILKEQGMEEQTSDYAVMYSTDFDKYRVEFETENGKVTKLTYVRSTGANAAADFTEIP